MSQGATFSPTGLRAAEGDATELVALPECTIAWVPLTAPSPYQDANAISSPVYFSLARETLLTEVFLPTRGGNDAWTLAGVAVFLGSEK